MALTQKELAALAKACMSQAARTLNPDEVPEDARAVLRYLVRPRLQHINPDKVDQEDLHKRWLASRLVRRALKVDMSKRANRKGGLPRALGLVGRVSKEKSARHLAVALMMGKLLEEGFRKHNAAVAVTEGFYEARIYRKLTGLTAANVEKIYERYWKPVNRASYDRYLADCLAEWQKRRPPSSPVGPRRRVFIISPVSQTRR